MGLTDTSFLWLLIVLAVVAFAAIVYWWRALAGPRPWTWFARAGALLGLNVIVVMIVAVALNDQYLFYLSWSDLFGTQTVTVATDHSGATANQAILATPSTSPGDPPPVPASTALPPNPPTSDRVVTYTVTGSASGLTGQVLVVMPQGYFDPANATRRYPVLEGFPGYIGTPQALVKNLDIPATNDQLVADHTVADTLYVMPVTSIPEGRDTECVNGPADQVETWVAHDIPAWITSHFRVDQTRAGWATFGISAGGWCAAMTTMLHPDQFSAAIVFSGYFRPTFENWAPFPPGSAAAHRYDLVYLAGHDPPPVALWTYVSRKDKGSYPTTHAVSVAARAPLSVTAQVASGGGHRWAKWDPLWAGSLRWLATSSPAFAPTR